MSQPTARTCAAQFDSPVDHEQVDRITEEMFKIYERERAGWVMQMVIAHHLLAFTLSGLCQVCRDNALKQLRENFPIIQSEAAKWAGDDEQIIH